MDLLAYFYIFLTALLFSLIMVPLLRRWAIEKQQLDLPDRRKVHVNPMPRLGGVGIFIAFLFAILVFVDLDQQIRGILAGSLILFVIGLIDDLHGLSAKKKFMGEIAACVVTMAVGRIYISQLGDLMGTGPIVLPLWLAVPFTMFAIVGVINALNLLDGLDGLAGGFSVIALGGFFLLGFKNGNIHTMVLCAALLGSVIGFLKYNSYPAVIFMGDAGSLTLGFLLGFIAIMATQSTGGGVTSPVVALIILGLPILDTLRVMASRLWHRVHPFHPDKTHVHHKFMDLGLNHRFTVIIIYGITLLWTMSALVFRKQPEYLLFFIYLASMVVSYVLLRIMIKHRQQLVIFQRDSSASFRETLLFLRISKECNHIAPLLVFIVVFYFLIAAFFPAVIPSQVSQLSLVILLIGIGSYYFSRDISHPVVTCVLLIAALLIAFQTEQILHAPFMGFGSPDLLVNKLFVVAAVMVTLKVIFRKPKELILTTPLEALLLGMTLSLGLVSRELQLAYKLPGFMFKVIVLLLAFKVLAIHSKATLRYLFYSAQGVLFVFVIRGLSI